MTCIDSPGTAAWDDLLQLALHVRPADAPTWHPPGIKAAIRHECESEREFTFADIVGVVVTAAMTRAARTPAVICHTASWPAKSTAAKIHAWHEGDPRLICGVCDLARDACTSRAMTNGHTFIARTDCLPPADRSGWVTQAAENLPAPTAPPPPARSLDDRLAAIPAEKRDPGLVAVRAAMAGEREEAHG